MQLNIVTGQPQPESDYGRPPYVIGQAIIFLPCGLFLSSSFFFPRLISAAADWMSTILPHMLLP